MRISRDKCWKCKKHIPADEIAVREFFWQEQPIPELKPWKRHVLYCTDCAEVEIPDDGKQYASPCEGCGRLLVYPDERTRHVCNYTCNIRACQPPKRLDVSYCENCGEEYHPGRSDQKYCCEKCRITAHRWLKKHKM